MKTMSISSPEGELLNLIESLGSLAWRKYQQRYSKVWIENKFQVIDESRFPPFVSFRFENEDAELVARLRDAVENFKGTIIWVLGEHKRTPLLGSNWIICPKRFWEIQLIALEAGKSASEYMAEQEPGFGSLAHEELAALTTHLYKILSK